MSSTTFSPTVFFSDGRNLTKIFILLCAFLCAAELPSLVNSDIQPWDEGMYALRVLSIHANGDFLDQSSHSVGGFYSAAHPPLLIWTGFLITLIFGKSAAVFKLIMLAVSLICAYLILIFGREFYSMDTGILAAMIFCGNIIFTVFSQRFQLDMPCVLFILISFFAFLKYNRSGKVKHLLLCGISFGLCLMTKILAGFFIPFVIFSFILLMGKRSAVSMKALMLITLTGIAIALPWHLYMVFSKGKEFTDYFFGFHLFERALYGVEENQKSSGTLFYVSYFMTILPFSAPAFAGCAKYIAEFRKASPEKIFASVWFLCGFLIISLMKTKLESYILLILLPASFLIPVLAKDLAGSGKAFRTLVLFLATVNIFWFCTANVRPELKQFVSENRMLSFVVVAISAALILALSVYLSGKIDMRRAVFVFVTLFFIFVTVYHAAFAPPWLNYFRLSDIRKYVNDGQRKKVVYVGTNFRYNPQFSFYFNGIDMNFNNAEYEFELIDDKSGHENTASSLSRIAKGSAYVIVEKDMINRAEYSPSSEFIPGSFRFIRKDNGYELYEN